MKIIKIYFLLFFICANLIFAQSWFDLKSPQIVDGSGFSTFDQSIAISTDQNGNCSIEIPIEEIGYYNLKVEVSHESILSNNSQIGLRVINRGSPPNYFTSSIVAGIAIVGFLVLNGFWIKAEIKKGGKLR